MKLNEGSFSFGTVITHVSDEPCQEKKLKSHLNSATRCQ